MPYQLNGKTLPLGVPFHAAGTNYPSNWLRLSTQAERDAIGIVWVDDEPKYDSRFYWGYDADGNLIPKDHSSLVSNWKTATEKVANTILSPSDWMVVREVDNAQPMPSGYKDWRQDIRNYCEGKVTSIMLTTTTDELATYITTQTSLFFLPK